MLPIFAKNKQQGNAGLIVKTRTPDENQEDTEEDKDDPSAAMESAAQDLINAIHSRDTKAVADALQAAFEIADLAPHAEGPHTFEAQNQKAAQEND